MIKLLVIADDLTGAMDTGVQFSGKGIRTLVTMDPGFCAGRLDADVSMDSLDVDVSIDSIDTDVSVLVVNTESRHLSASDAYQRVYRTAQSAKKSGIAYVMKKTDSTLRGNIGSELQAVVDAWDTPDLMFLPAYPANGRTTVNGRQYVHGMPLELTPFAGDPLEPMTSSDIRNIIGRQCAYSTVSAEAPDRLAGMDSGQKGKTIHIIDSRTQEELRQAVHWLNNRHLLLVTAGCAGLATALADALEFDKKVVCPESKPRFPCPDFPFGRMLTVCGSLNAVSQAQIAYAADHGCIVIKMTPEEKLAAIDADEWLLDDKANEISRLMDAGKDVILAAALGIEDVASGDRLAQGNGISGRSLSAIISGNMAKIVQAVFRSQDRILLVIFGGDTAIGIMNQLGVQTLEPCREIQPGIVLSKLETGSKTSWLVTKAGGFGETDILKKIRESICPTLKPNESISPTPKPNDCSTEG